LPDALHGSIASFLPDGDKGNASRLCISEVTRALLGPYGSSLTRICLGYVTDSSAAQLVALLRRQEKLIEVNVVEQDSIPPLCMAIVQVRLLP